MKAATTNLIEDFLRSNEFTKNYIDIMVCENEIDANFDDLEYSDDYISYNVTIQQSNYKFSLDIITDVFHTEYYIYMYSILSNLEFVEYSFPIMYCNEIDKYFPKALVPHQDSLT